MTIVCSIITTSRRSDLLFMTGGKNTPPPPSGILLSWFGLVWIRLQRTKIKSRAGGRENTSLHLFLLFFSLPPPPNPPFCQFILFPFLTLDGRHRFIGAPPPPPSPGSHDSGPRGFTVHLQFLAWVGLFFSSFSLPSLPRGVRVCMCVFVCVYSHAPWGISRTYISGRWDWRFFYFSIFPLFFPLLICWTPSTPPGNLWGFSSVYVGVGREVTLLDGNTG